MFLPAPLLRGKYIKMEHFPLEAFDSKFRGAISHVTHAKSGGIWQSCLKFNEGEGMNLYLSCANGYNTMIIHQEFSAQLPIETPQSARINPYKSAKKDTTWIKQ